MNEPQGSRVTESAAPGRPSLLDRWFRPVHVPLEAPREIAALAHRGSVVFVVRSAGLLNFLIALDALDIAAGKKP